MIYTEMTKKAMRVAFDAHAGQLDGCGMPYILHPVHIAEQMQDEVTTAVALLHDVAEDTRVTLGDLAGMGFPKEVIEALRLLTHEKGADYFDYVRAVKENPAARAVKLADVEHNRDATRLEAGDPRIEAWEAKYSRAHEILTELRDDETCAPGFLLKVYATKEIYYYPDKRSSYYYYEDFYPVKAGEEVFNTGTLSISFVRVIPHEGKEPDVELRISKRCIEIDHSETRIRCGTNKTLHGLKESLNLSDAGLNCSDYFTQYKYTLRLVREKQG